MRLFIETEINTSADTVWDILGHQFADIGMWFTGVDYSRALTTEEIPAEISVAERAPIPGRITQNKAGTMKEFLVKYSDQDRSFTFYVTGIPRFIISHSENNSRVIEIAPDKCLLVFDIYMKFILPFMILSPLLKQRLRKMMQGLHAELANYAMTGKIRVEKQEQIAKLKVRVGK